MKRKSRRATEIFSLSFLDCLCCGFGAILLLFLLTLGTRDHLDDTAAQADSSIREMRETLIREQEEILERENKLSEAEQRAESLDLRRQLQADAVSLRNMLTETEAVITSLSEQVDAQQRARAEGERLLRTFPYRDMPPIGLPTEATHVVFVIDTSGSMRDHASGRMHPQVVARISYVLENLPEVRFIQFIDTSGRYMLPDNRGIWIRDNPRVRSTAQQLVRDYPAPSASDPEQGMRRAFNDLLPLLSRNDEMAMFVFGDDVRRATATLLVAVDRMNPIDPNTGERRATISAIAFPMLVRGFQLGFVDGSTRFANVMREIVHDHGGILLLSHL
jgi:Sec-independent protein translocase protein TatA